MFCIKSEIDNYYFHNEGKIIIFDTVEEAQFFLQGFMNYSMNRGLQEFGADFAFTGLKKLSSLEIIPLDFNCETCETINLKNIAKK